MGNACGKVAGGRRVTMDCQDWWVRAAEGYGVVDALLGVVISGGGSREGKKIGGRRRWRVLSLG